MNMDQTDQLIVDRIKGVVGNSSLLKEKFKKEILNKKSIDSKQISQDKKNLETTIKGLDQQLETNLKSISQVEVNHMLKKIENKRYKVISKLLEEVDTITWIPPASTSSAPTTTVSSFN